MQAGKLDRRVALLRQGPGVDDGLQVVPGPWEVLGVRAASVKPARGREAAVAQGTVAYALLTCWLRWDSVTRQLEATDAVEFEGRRYALAAPPVEIGRREGVELLLVAGDDQ